MKKLILSLFSMMSLRRKVTPLQAYEARWPPTRPRPRPW
jgi:hypothetical protein